MTVIERTEGGRARTYPFKFPGDLVLKSAAVGANLVGNAFNCLSTLKNWMRFCQCDDTYSTELKVILH